MMYLYQVFVMDHGWEYLTDATPCSKLEKLLVAARKELCFSGKCIIGPKVLFFARPSYHYDFGVGYAWKQQDNGLCFIASPVRLEYLEDDEGCSDEFLYVDTESGNYELHHTAKAFTGNISAQMNKINKSHKIEETINRYTELKESGSYLKGACPLCENELRLCIKVAQESLKYTGEPNIKQLEKHLNGIDLDIHGHGSKSSALQILKRLESVDRGESLTVTPEKQIFYCFSCFKGGDYIAFICQLKNISPMDVIEMAKRKAEGK